jgi:hypothetical protein
MALIQVENLKIDTEVGKLLANRGCVIEQEQ